MARNCRLLPVIGGTFGAGAKDKNDIPHLGNTLGVPQNSKVIVFRMFLRL